MALCGLFCAIVLMSQETFAGSNLAPVPLVTQPAPSQALLATWAHVESYTGSYSADIQTSADGGWHEHFSGTLVLAPMCPNCPSQASILVFQGSSMTSLSVSGDCGSANTTEHTQVVLSVRIASRT